MKGDRVADLMANGFGDVFGPAGSQLRRENKTRRIRFPGKGMHIGHPARARAIPIVAAAADDHTDAISLIRRHRSGVALQRGERGLLRGDIDIPGRVVFANLLPNGLNVSQFSRAEGGVGVDAVGRRREGGAIFPGGSRRSGVAVAIEENHPASPRLAVEQESFAGGIVEKGIGPAAGGGGPAF